MNERFETFWPVDARLVHVRDREAENPNRALCSSGWVMDGRYAEDYTVPTGQEYLICATCAKIRARRTRSVTT